MPKSAHLAPPQLSKALATLRRRPLSEALDRLARVEQSLSDAAQIAALRDLRLALLRRAAERLKTPPFGTATSRPTRSCGQDRVQDHSITGEREAPAVQTADAIALPEDLRGTAAPPEQSAEPEAKTELPGKTSMISDAEAETMFAALREQVAEDDR